MATFGPSVSSAFTLLHYSGGLRLLFQVLQTSRVLLTRVTLAAPAPAYVGLQRVRPGTADNLCCWGPHILGGKEEEEDGGGGGGKGLKKKKKSEDG